MGTTDQFRTRCRTHLSTDKRCTCVTGVSRVGTPKQTLRREPSTPRREALAVLSSRTLARNPSHSAMQFLTPASPALPPAPDISFSPRVAGHKGSSLEHEPQRLIVHEDVTIQEDDVIQGDGAIHEDADREFVGNAAANSLVMQSSSNPTSGRQDRRGAGMSSFMAASLPSETMSAPSPALLQPESSAVPAIPPAWSTVHTDQMAVINESHEPGPGHRDISSHSDRETMADPDYRNGSQSHHHEAHDPKLLPSSLQEVSDDEDAAASLQQQQSQESQQSPRNRSPETGAQNEAHASCEVVSPVDPGHMLARSLSASPTSAWSSPSPRHSLRSISSIAPGGSPTFHVVMNEPQQPPMQQAGAKSSGDAAAQQTRAVNNHVQPQEQRGDSHLHGVSNLVTAGESDDGGHDEFCIHSHQTSAETLHRGERPAETEQDPQLDHGSGNLHAAVETDPRIREGRCYGEEHLLHDAPDPLVAGADPQADARGGMLEEECTAEAMTLPTNAERQARSRSGGSVANDDERQAEAILEASNAEGEARSSPAVGQVRLSEGWGHNEGHQAEAMSHQVTKTADAEYQARSPTPLWQARLSEGFGQAASPGKPTRLLHLDSRGAFDDADVVHYSLDFEADGDDMSPVLGGPRSTCWAGRMSEGMSSLPHSLCSLSQPW